MKVRDLLSRIELFRKDLDEHATLWSRSLDSMLPDYPIRNHESLRLQCASLARQLGALRPYLEKLGLPTVMGTAYSQWDAFDSAVSDDVAARKGSSMQAVLSQLQQALGRLDIMDHDSDFELQPERTKAPPQHVTNIYNLQGAHSRVNVQSQDSSVNISSITEQQVFTRVREALTSGVGDERERAIILEKLDSLEKSIHSGNSLSSYQAFINAVASHMTIILPFIPALTQMLK